MPRVCLPPRDTVELRQHAEQRCSSVPTAGTVVSKCTCCEWWRKGARVCRVGLSGDLFAFCGCGASVDGSRARAARQHMVPGAEPKASG
eukprot:m.1187779 g.1187779  ORF g.1187779 m.1187779 type:complete len:89 (-) comp24550_c1_seq2:1280-1546(-)